MRYKTSETVLIVLKINQDTFAINKNGIFETVAVHVKNQIANYALCERPIESLYLPK